MTNAQQKIAIPFNEEFCTLLEYRICHELEKSTDPDLKGFWCDGVSWLTTEKQLTKKNVNDKRKIKTKAWLGKNGQTEFKTTVHLGKNPEQALCKANDKFERRFRQIEANVAKKNKKIEQCDLNELDSEWENVKRSERN